MIDCYGCGHPMHYAFTVYETTADRYPYCVHCCGMLKLKRIAPGDHEKGAVSNGTPTMRRRSR